MVDNIVRKCNTSDTSDNSAKYKEKDKFLSKSRSTDEHGEKKNNPSCHDAKNRGNPQKKNLIIREFRVLRFDRRFFSSDDILIDRHSFEYADKTR